MYRLRLDYDGLILGGKQGWMSHEAVDFFGIDKLRQCGDNALKPFRRNVLRPPLT
jgi:hypothetical protein